MLIPSALTRPQVDLGACADCGNRSPAPLRSRPVTCRQPLETSCLSAAPAGRTLTDQAAHSRLPRFTQEVPGPAPRQSVTSRSDRETGRVTEDGAGTSAPTVGRRTVMKGQARSRANRAPVNAAPNSGDLRWWPGGASPSVTSGPFPVHVAFVEDRLPYAVNPVGVLSIKILKITISVLGCGPGTSFPQAGPLKVRPADFRQIEFSRICAE